MSASLAVVAALRLAYPLCAGMAKIFEQPAWRGESGAPQRAEMRCSGRERRGSKKSPRRAVFLLADIPWCFGAGEGIRTLDPNLGKVVLYP
jgi:hypothetical protein